MSRTLKLALSAGALAAALGASSLAAQEQTPQKPQSDSPNMMQDGGMTSDDGMMPMMGMMQQMSEMMEACTKMMQAKAGEQAPDTTPDQPQDQQ
jgi:hypothetical protein